MTLVLAATSTAAGASSLEYAIMPGPVSRAHADVETECSRCHVLMDRDAQRVLCSECHLEVAADILRKTGFHGRLPATQCRQCHTEHKGRDARIVVLDPGAFDHGGTDFALRGVHRKVACEQCHRPGTRHREAPTQCADCHRDDDPHHAALGSSCADCHQESGWKGATFDHAVTAFPLRERHRSVDCTGCHPDHRYKGTASRCVACHAGDDVHYDALGERCETCHQEAGWDRTTFDHGEHTRFALLGWHAAVECAGCHADDRFRAAPPTQCAGCHRGDDPHAGRLGTACDTCHQETGWTPARLDHDRQTRFPLRGKHRAPACADCHDDMHFQAPTLRQCGSCHRDDDAKRGHRGRFGKRCETCHTEAGWGSARFDHAGVTGFALAGQHGSVRCVACHTGMLYQDKLSTRCESCHLGDDAHGGELGRACGRCHQDSGWKPSRFDHSRSAFPLLGRHREVACGDCHRDDRFKTAQTHCIACHGEDDRHERRLGIRCDQCHDNGAWANGRFDHDAKTSFRLEGAHRKAACTACHREPVTGAIELADACIGCHRGDDVHFRTLGERCDACHVASRWRDVSGQAREWARAGTPPVGTAARP